jgi:DNA-binding PadR family transcriptional regulator
VAYPKKKKPLLAGRSPLRAAVLAVLLEGPCHGYEVSTRLKMRVGPSWRIYAKHLYPVLKQLEKDKLVESELLPGDGPERDRQVYYPTPAAWQARDEWMGTPASLGLVRADIVARLVFSRPEEAPAILETLDRYEQDVIEALEADAAVDTPEGERASQLLSGAKLPTAAGEPVPSRLEGRPLGQQPTPASAYRGACPRA